MIPYFFLFFIIFPLYSDDSKKIMVYPLLNAQGFSKEKTVTESKKFYKILESLSLKIVNKEIISLENIPEKIPSFKKLSIEAKGNGADYFIWASVRLSGDKSHRNIYIVDTSSGMTVDNFFIECREEICNDEEMGELKEKFISFCISNSIPFEILKETEPDSKNYSIDRQKIDFSKSQKSILFPGLGQYAMGKENKSYLLMGSFAFCFYNFVSQREFSHSEHRESSQMFQAGFISLNQNLPAPASLYYLYRGNYLKKDSKEWSDSSEAWLNIAAGIYLFNLYDAFYISPDTKLSVQLSPSIRNLTGNFRQSSSNFSIAITREIDL
jgi:hypothetical protein